MSDEHWKEGTSHKLFGFWLQTGFVNAVASDGLVLPSLQAALSHIFHETRDNVILLCNGIPVCFNYRDDLPLIIPGILNCLDALQQHKDLDNYELHIKTQSIDAVWLIHLRKDVISITMKWLRVRGNYQAALNAFDAIAYEKDIFLNEWLILLKQCQQCLADTRIRLIDKGLEEQKLLNKVESHIHSFGRFYQHLNLERKSVAI